jgi:diguanylate cyclase (GGDEF)-like protein
MYPLKYKVILTVLLLIILLPLIYSLFTGFSLFESEPSYLFNVMSYLAVLFGIAIILSPILLETNGHWACFFIGAVVMSVLALATGQYYYLFWLIVLLGISIAIQVFYKQRIDIMGEKINAVTKVKEAVNIVKLHWQQAKEFNNALSQRLDRYRRLREIGESFSARLAVEDICRLAVETAYEIIPKTDTAMLFLVNKNQQKLMLSTSKKVTELPKIKSKTGDIFDKWVFKERQSLSVEDINEDFRFDYTPLSGERYFKSLISVPMINQSRIIGILRLNSGEKNSYSFDDLRLLDFISDLTSSAVNNARLYKTTEELSTKDSLTGFYIHRYLKESLIREVDRARVNRSFLSLIMIDIDHFKDYNDKYGHSAGDKVLVGIARIIRNNAIKYSQLIARYGGEEFVIVLPDMDKDKARELAEKIRLDISTRKFSLRRKETRVTVSAGVASYSDEITKSEELLKKTDFLLYKAKKEGRNKICVA